MDFTREPIIETIITPKEGFKLVVRSSKSSSQEEYFVDAIEIVSFGNALFYRSLERPKAFLAPVSDYEILEVREARMVLKNAGLERSIKIGGGRDTAAKSSRAVEKEVNVEEPSRDEEAQVPSDSEGEGSVEGRVDKKRDRRRHVRKRRGREEGQPIEPTIPPLEDDKIVISPPFEGSEGTTEAMPASPGILSTLLQPPPTLISETINRYRQNDMFKGAFYLSEEEQYKPHDKVQELLNEDDEEAPSLHDPAFEPESAEDNFSEKEENVESQESHEHFGELIENENGFGIESEEPFDASGLTFEDRPALSIYEDEEDKSMLTKDQAGNRKNIDQQDPSNPES